MRFNFLQQVLNKLNTINTKSSQDFESQNITKGWRCCHLLDDSPKKPVCKIYWMFISYSKYNCFNKNLEKYKSVEFECQQWPLFSQRRKGLKWGKRNQGFFSLKGVPIYYEKRKYLPISSQLGIDHFQYLYLNNLREKKVKGFPRTWFYMYVDGFTVGTMSF
jgi:hypothetical protein